MKVGDLVSHIDHPRLIGIVIKTTSLNTPTRYSRIPSRYSVPRHTIKWLNEKEIPDDPLGIKRKWCKPTIFSQSKLKLLSEA